MYSIEKSQKDLGSGNFSTYSREIINCNILKVEAGTTGLMGGDTGHGGRTYFRIEDAASTDIHIAPVVRDKCVTGFEVSLGGDTELITIIEALKFITQVLEEGIWRKIN